MYLWKYWRESRITFAVALLLVALMLWAVLKISLGAAQHDGQDSNRAQRVEQREARISGRRCDRRGWRAQLI